MQRVLYFALFASLVLAWQPPLAVVNCNASHRLCDSMSALVQWANVNRTAASMVAAIGTTNAYTGPKPLEYVATAGRFVYDDNAAAVTAAARFDMASCSKIMGATTAVAQLYQRGLIDLHEKATTYLGADFAAHDKGDIRIENLLLHNAGFPPDPNPGYSSPVFPCPQNKYYHPGQEFSCDEIIFQNLVYNQTLVYPTGAKFIYSDLSFITLMFVVGAIVKSNQLVPAASFPAACAARTDSLVCNFWAFVKTSVFDRYGMAHTDYIPASPLDTPPAWNDPWYHHGLIMGYVSDQNAYALGGVSGHAGVFSTVEDALRFARVWANASPNDPVLNSTTVALFTTVVNATQSSRALGWDTNDQPAPPCGSMSPKTYFHIGYTGTQFCVDPVNGFVTVLLTNARYPDYLVDLSIAFRPIYNTLATELVAEERQNH